MYEKRKKCITSFSSRFKVNDTVKYCRFSNAECKYGIIVEIVDVNPYSYTYKIKWFTENETSIEELDGVWLDMVY